MNTPKCVEALLLSIVPFLVQAQENIPIGIFRLHVSYNAIRDITFDGVARTFAAAPHGILLVDREHGETTTYSKANGITGGTITSVEFDPGTRKLVVAYAEGYFDVVDEGPASVQFDPASNAVISGSRRINEVTVSNRVAYLATDYGVVVFDLVRNQVRETWRDLGISGEALAVQHSAITSDSAFLSTPQGVMAGKLTDNLQDFSKWKRYLHWPFGNPVSGLAVWHDVLYGAIDHAGLFRCDNGVWTQVKGVPVDQYFSLQLSQVLMVSATSGVYQLDDGGTTLRIASPLFAAPRFAITDGNGNSWIGDQQAGLLTNANGAFASLLPQCPANDTITQVRYTAGKMFAVGGGHDENGLPLHRRGVVDVFDQGRWSQVSLPAQDLTDVLWEESTQTLTAASYGFGVVVKAAGSEPVVYNERNSTLHNTLSPTTGVLVTSLAKVTDGIAAMNYAVSPELHHVDAAGGWVSYAIPAPTARYGEKIVVDDGDNTWSAIDSKKGGGVVVFNRNSGMTRRLTDGAGQGALPSLSVHSLCLDRAGAMWIGTASGVAFVPNASSILQSSADAIKPILDGRFVLRDDAVTAIAVDGGDRKWFGTQRGIWLYSAAADEEIGHFTASNSALPSDKIIDLEINPQTGEVFMATEQGLASYRAGATEPRQTSGAVKIFPNPVAATFTGSVGIAGTPTDAVVKITDAAGKLVWETRANGSTATWNLIDDRGRRVPSGVYIVFTVSDDGEQHEAGKLAVIN